MTPDLDLCVRFHLFPVGLIFAFALQVGRHPDQKFAWLEPLHLLTAPLKGVSFQMK